MKRNLFIAAAVLLVHVVFLLALSGTLHWKTGEEKILWCDAVTKVCS